MISTKNHSSLPDRKSLETISKAISVLDAILCQEWQYRYYSYNSKWDTNERCLQMRNGSGDEMHILFREDGCVINGFAHEYEQQDKVKLTKNLPAIFDELIFGEPVKSIGTTFCLWTTEVNNWQVGQIEDFDDNSEEMLNIFDGQPQTYIDWATEYFDENYKESGIPLDTVLKIYEGQTLTKEMILSMVDELEDWEQLKKDLEEIDYPYNFE
jgi:rhamnogalacturonyl hydrolase YesR